MRRKLLDTQSDDNPLAGVANLFETGIVFALALMIALVSRYNMPEMLTDSDFSMIKNAGKENMEVIVKKGNKIEKYKSKEATTSGGGQGKKVGTAYELENGEIIYIPE